MNEYTKETTQCSSRVLMIRPTAFGRDDEAAETNSFMKEAGESGEGVSLAAQQEFDALALALGESGVDVLVIEDDLRLPDSVFPNNWISFHSPTEGSPVLITYPMCTKSRRRERRDEVLDEVSAYLGIRPDHLDLSAMEDDGVFLEGTGSLVLDRLNGVVYACLSGRTHESALDAWCDETGYRAIAFHASDAEGRLVYHTNVILSIGSHLAVVCLEAIGDPDERELVRGELSQSGRRVLEITLDQVTGFCGNLLELTSRTGEPRFAMSQAAYEHFNADQRGLIESLGKIVRVPIPTIERVAGGSVRCMIAELGSV